MSIAWSGVVLLVLLLPGFLFFVGLTFPEKFTREAVERSALGQLAGTVLIALLVHAALFLTNQYYCGAHVPCISTRELLAAISLDSSKTPDVLDEVSATLAADGFWILSYFILASGLGTLAGYATGTLIVTGRLRFLAQHRWIYDLKVDDTDVLVVAYILSNVAHEGRHVVYRGFLKAFGLQRDGRFSYLVLSNVVRYYLTLESGGPATSPPADWHVIGATIDDENQPLSLTGGGRRQVDRSYLVIEGEDVANVIFDRYAFPFSGSTSELKRLEKTIDEIESARQASPAGGGPSPVALDDGQEPRADNAAPGGDAASPAGRDET